MPRYTSASNRRPTPPVERPHPVWRGLGCIIILIIPVISFAAAYLTAQIALAGNWPLPYQLLGPPAISPVLWRVAALVPLWTFIQSQNNLYLILTFAVVYALLLSVTITIIYAFVYRFAGPPRYGPLDEPPPNIKVKRYKR